LNSKKSEIIWGDSSYVILYLKNEILNIDEFFDELFDLQLFATLCDRLLHGVINVIFHLTTVNNKFEGFVFSVNVSKLEAFKAECSHPGIKYKDRV